MGLAIGNKFEGYPRCIYNELKKGGFKPDFVLFCFPTSKRIKSYKLLNPWIRRLSAFIVGIAPIFILKLFFKNYIPPKDLNVYFLKDINGNKFHKIMENERPDYLLIYSCGIISAEICKKYKNKLLAGHASKLPKYRGVNNVEWTYYLDDELYGTIQFIAPKMDTGDIIFEKRINKLNGEASITKIRNHAFTKTFRLFPNALKKIEDKHFNPKKQRKVKTNRYVMHPFLLDVLEKRLRIN